MKKILLTLFVSTLFSSAFAQQVDTLVWRIKAMRCDDCANKVMTAVTRDKGVKDVRFDLEKRTTTIAYDPAVTSPDSIMNKLRGTRYRPSAYSKTEVIFRGYGMYMPELTDGQSAKKIKESFGTSVGLDSLATHPERHYLFVRYDANKTCKATLRASLMKLGFTPTNFYTSKDISFTSFKLPSQKFSSDFTETVLGFDGVDDATLNPSTRTLAITYLNKETNVQKLTESLKKLGVKF
jgi:copper chaperone CopZ